MIIRQLRAENLFRYKKIDLAALPAPGRVGISGPNEAGKSALLEAICLALFGRTYSLSARELAKVVKWGETTASVYLGFSARNGREYSVTRYIDADGSQRARLALADAGEEVAKGVAEVDQALLAVLGYDFQSFVDTFYQPQRLGGWEKADSATIKVLAGVEPVEATSRALADQELASEAAMISADEEERELRRRLDELALEPATLGQLQSQRTRERAQAETEQQELAGWERFAGDLDHATRQLLATGQGMAASDGDTPLALWRERENGIKTALQGFDALCQDCHVEMDEDPTRGVRKWLADLGERLTALEEVLGKVAYYRREQGRWLGELDNDSGKSTHAREQKEINARRRVFTARRGRLRLVAWLFVLTALVTGGVGGALLLLPEMPLTDMMQTLLAAHVPGWQAEWSLGLAGLGGVLLALGLSFLIRARADGKGVAACDKELIHLEGQRERALAEDAAIDAAQALPLAAQMADLRRLSDPAWVADLSRWMAEDGAKLVDDEGRRGLLKELDKRMRTLDQEITALLGDVQESMRESREKLATCQGVIQRLDAAILAEEARRQQDRELRQRIDQLQSRLEHEQRAISVRQHARRLLLGTARELANQFNDELRRYVSTLIPLFTQGRYQHLKIDNDLNVQAFSLEKNDFTDFDEVSNGVRHQLTLAVRVAMAQALITRTAQGPQCLLLDEPFAFFDQERLKHTLDSLRQVGGDLNQFIIIFQELPAKFPFDLAIACPRDNNVLGVGGH